MTGKTEKDAVCSKCGKRMGLPWQGNGSGSNIFESIYLKGEFVCDICHVQEEIDKFKETPF